MAQKIIQRVQAHYEVREVSFGKTYEWHNAYVALECECGQKTILSATSTITTCRRCDADLGDPTPRSTPKLRAGRRTRRRPSV